MLLNSDIANSDINKYTLEFLENKWMITVACVIGLIFIVLYVGHKISQENKVKYAKFLACTRQTALIIGSNLFVHAAIVPDLAKEYKVK